MADYPKTVEFHPWIITPDETEQASIVLAKFAVLLEPNIDQDEAQDIILAWLDETDLNVVNVIDLVSMLRCTIYNSKFDTMH